MSFLLEAAIRHKRFGAQEVLRGIDLRLAEGEIVSLVGASGCGKSTLLRIVAGLDGDYYGEVRLAGERVTAPRREIRFVFQEPRLFPWLTVAQNVSFDLGSRAADAGRAAALLAEVGLAGLDAGLPKQLSGGQAQRVAIARALFVRPHLLLLDEPFSAVDAFTRLKLQDLLLAVARTHGITVLLVTHDIAEATRLSDRVLVLEAAPGRVVAEICIDAARPRDDDLDDGGGAAAASVRRALRAAHAF